MKQLHPVLRAIAYLFRSFDLMAAAAFLLIFAFFCSARVGYFLLLVLFSAPLFSMLFAFLFARKIIVESEYSGVHLEKGGRANLKITLRNPLPLPSPPVEVRLLSSPQLSGEEEVQTVYLLPRGKSEIEFTLTAHYAGGSMVGVRSVTVWDHFRLKSFVSSAGDPDRTYAASVMPEIPEIAASDPVLEQAMVSAFQTGDSDEASEVPSFTFGGTPGYEYREYVPGDPLKRVAGKLSARTRNLMVRLDDKNAVSGISLILDPVCKKTEDPELLAIWYQELCETALGMAYTLLSRDFSVRMFYCDKHGWREHRILSDQDLHRPAEDLSEVSFGAFLSEEMGRIPGEEMYKGAETFLYFSADPDGEVRTLLSDLAGGDQRLVNLFDASAGKGQEL